MRIIFHLGSYKTGSSSFQNMLFENRNMLLQKGILYPKSGLTADSKLGRRHTHLIYNYTRGKDWACPDDLLNELSTSSAETAILSSEAWSRPEHLSHLTRLVSSLQEAGHHDCSGFLVLRRLEDYQVSHYREFTINQSNTLPYKKYIQRHHGTFDYLLLSRSFRSIFGSRFIALPFDAYTDITLALCKSMGIGPLYNQMARLKRSNVNSLGALEVEAIRCAKKLKKTKEDGLSILSDIISENSNVRGETWTERHSDDVPGFTSTYRKNLQEALNWSEYEIDNLFQQSDPKGHNVRKLRKILLDRLNCTP